MTHTLAQILNDDDTPLAQVIFDSRDAKTDRYMPRAIARRLVKEGKLDLIDCYADRVAFCPTAGTNPDEIRRLCNPL